MFEIAARQQQQHDCRYSSLSPTTVRRRGFLSKPRKRLGNDLRNMNSLTQAIATAPQRTTTITAARKRGPPNQNNRPKTALTGVAMNAVQITIFPNHLPM